MNCANLYNCAFSFELVKLDLTCDSRRNSVLEAVFISLLVINKVPTKGEPEVNLKLLAVASGDGGSKSC